MASVGLRFEFYTSILGPRLEYVFGIRVEYGLKLQFYTEYGPFEGHLEYVEYVFTQ